MTTSPLKQGSRPSKHNLVRCAENNHCYHQDSMGAGNGMLEAVKGSRLIALMSLSAFPGHVSSSCYFMLQTQIVSRCSP